MSGILLEPQPHRMNLEANHLRSLIGMVHDNFWRCKCETWRSAVQLAEHQINVHEMFFEAENPLKDADQAYRSLRSKVEHRLESMGQLYVNEDYGLLP